MSKKTIILTIDSENMGNTLQAVKYLKYAHEHNLNIKGEMHLPFIMAFIAPEQLVELVASENPEVVIANDEPFIVANFYHNGELVKLFEQKGIQVINTELDLQQFNNEIDEDMRSKLKEAVNYAIEETFKSEEQNGAVIITNNANRKEVLDFTEYLGNSGISRIHIFDIDEFNHDIEIQVNKVIQKSDINKVIIYDKELMDESLLKYLHNLQSTLDISVSFADDIYDEMEQIHKMQSMSYS